MTRWALAVAAAIVTFTVCWWVLEGGYGWQRGDALALGTVPFTVVLSVAAYWAGRERPAGPERLTAEDEETVQKAGHQTVPSIGLIADQLASAVLQQWEQEAALRRLYDPYPLSVSWTAADEALTDDWAHLERLAKGADWPAPRQPQAWARNPSELAGKGDGLAGIVAKVPTRRMMVLGEPGSGKTMLMVRLLLVLMRHRLPGDPVPILLPLASWDPNQQDLRVWLRAQMCIEHPSLATPAPVGSGTGDRAEALLAKGLIVPILDGLDEIPASFRGPAIARINEAPGFSEGLVVTCRMAEYRSAARPVEGPEIILRAAAAIRLKPPGTNAVAKYLLDDAGGPISRDRWRPVIAVLGTQEPVAQALTTPLMIGLARIIYNPLPGDLNGKTPAHQPAELLSHARFPDRKSVENHLLDVFIWAAYKPGPEHSRRLPNYGWSYEQAKRWLVFLARNQETQERGTLDIAWWRLSDTLDKNLTTFIISSTLGIVAAIGYPFQGFGIGLTIGLLAGLFIRAHTRKAEIKLTYGLTGGLIGGAIAGLIVLAIFGLGYRGYGAGYIAWGLGLGIAVAPLACFIPSLIAGFSSTIIVLFYENAKAFHSLELGVGAWSHVFNGIGVAIAAILTVDYARRRDVPAHGLRWSPTWAVCGVSTGVFMGLFVWVQLGWVPGLAVSLAAAAAGSLVGRTAGAEATDPTKAASPYVVLRHDRTSFLGSWLVFGIGLGLVSGVSDALSRNPDGHLYGFKYGLEVGLSNMMVPGLGLGLIQAAWGLFFVSRCWLALRGRLPWRFMTFLRDAHVNRGVLRQVGAVYQFRHIDLQRRIAEWPSGSGSKSTGDYGYLESEHSSQP
jgi:NACHT domain